MLGYNDEKWNDEIQNKTRREWRNLFGGLQRYGSGVYVGEDDIALNNLINDYQKACVARREHPNAPPVNLTPISEAEFAQSTFFHYTPRFVEHRQIYPWDDENQKPAFNNAVWPWEGYEGYTPPLGKYYRKGQMISAQLFYMWDGTGFLITRDYWDGKVHYYRFGCQHEWGAAPEGHPARGRHLFRTEHLSYCVKCGHWHVVDSSD